MVKGTVDRGPRGRRGSSTQSSNNIRCSIREVRHRRSRTTSPMRPNTRADPTSVPISGSVPPYFLSGHRSPRGHCVLSIFAFGKKRELAANILLQSNRLLKIHENRTRPGIRSGRAPVNEAPGRPRRCTCLPRTHARRAITPKRVRAVQM